MDMDKNHPNEKCHKQSLLNLSHVMTIMLIGLALSTIYTQIQLSLLKYRVTELENGEAISTGSEDGRNRYKRHIVKRVRFHIVHS